MDLNRVCHTNESLKLLPEFEQNLVVSTANEIDVTDLKSSSFFVYNFFKRAGMQLSAGLFENLEHNDSIEVWSVSPDFSVKYCMAVGPILEQTSYRIRDLCFGQWENLLERPLENQLQIVASAKLSLQTGQTQLDVTDFHVVKETKSKFKFKHFLKVKAISPVHFPEAKFTGIIAVVQTRRLPGLILPLMQFFRSLSYRLHWSFQNLKKSISEFFRPMN